MISYLKGQVIEKSDESVLIDVNGVGYELQCSFSSLQDLPLMETKEIWVQSYLREDSISLFGFSTQVEKKLFLSLLKVNGVGPKMALKILSGASMDRLTAMIEAGDVKSLSGLPKVGKKTAEQIVLSLKGKLAFSVDAGAGEQDKNRTLQSTRSERAGARISHRLSKSQTDVLSALMNLGFRVQDVEQMVLDLPQDIDVEQGVRKGLQTLAGA